jgi:membrane protease YdiL (CAAX protease family)
MSSVTLASAAGVALALGVTPLLAFAKRGKRAAPIRPWRHLLVTWGTCVALLLLVRCWERRPWSSIGIVFDNVHAWAVGALVGVGVLMLTGLSLQLAKKKTTDGSVQGLLKLAATPLWFRIAAVITAGVTEEIVFRGYPIERLGEMSGNPWLALLVPLAVFTLAHLSGWSASHLLSVLIGGAILTGLYVWQHDLVACMIAHTIIDMPIVFLPLLTRKLAAASQADPGAAPG